MSFCLFLLIKQYSYYDPTGEQFETLVGHCYKEILERTGIKYIDKDKMNQWLKENNFNEIRLKLYRDINEKEILKWKKLHGMRYMPSDF